MLLPVVDVTFDNPCTMVVVLSGAPRHMGTAEVLLFAIVLTLSLFHASSSRLRFIGLFPNWKESFPWDRSSLASSQN